MKADAEFKEAVNVFAIGRVESESTDRLREGFLLFLVRDRATREPLRLLGSVSLREVHHVNRLSPRSEQRLNGL